MNNSIPVLDRTNKNEFSALDNLFKGKTKNVKHNDDFLSFQKKYEYEYKREDKTSAYHYKTRNENRESHWQQKNDKQTHIKNDSRHEEHKVQRDVPKKEDKTVDAHQKNNPHKKVNKKSDKNDNDSSPDVVNEENNTTEETPKTENNSNTPQETTDTAAQSNTSEENTETLESKVNSDLTEKIAAALLNKQTSTENIDIVEKATQSVDDNTTQDTNTINNSVSIEIPVKEASVVNELSAQVEEKIVAAKQTPQVPLSKDATQQLPLDNKTLELEHMKDGKILETGDIKIKELSTTTQKNNSHSSQNILEQLTPKASHIHSNRSQHQSFENNNENNESFSQNSFLNQLNKSAKNIVNKIKQVAVKNLEQRHQTLHELSSESQKAATAQKMSAAQQTGIPSRLNAIQGIQEIITRMQGILKGGNVGKQLSIDFESATFGRIQMTIQQSGTSIEVNLQTGSEQSKEQLMNQRDELARQMKKLGFEQITMDIHSDSKQHNQERENETAGNEDIENVKLAGNDQDDLQQALADAQKMSA